MKYYVDKKINDKSTEVKKENFFWTVYKMQQSYTEDQIKQHTGVEVEEMNLAIWTYKMNKDPSFVKM